MALPDTLRRIGRLPIRLMKRLMAVFFWLVSWVVPRSNRIWVFGSWHGLLFADNPRYFFLYCSGLARSPVRPVWLSRNRSVIRFLRHRGLRAHHRLSLFGLWYRLRAGVYLFNSRIMDIASSGFRGATVINLWHGIPLKKIERDIEQPDNPITLARNGPPLRRFAIRLLHPQLTERYDYVLGTSAMTAPRLMSAFGVTHGQILNAGYPRTDPLVSGDGGLRHLMPAETRLLDEIRSQAAAGRRVLLYMPTFRDWNNDRSRVIPVDWIALDQTLNEHGGILYCKLHLNDQAQVPSDVDLSRIRLVPSDLDIYPALRFTDALITDYSSVFFDYLLLDKPVVFYAYDLDAYQRLSRTLYDRYEDVTPGPKVSTPAELTEAVIRLLEDYPTVRECWKAERARVRQLVHDFSDGSASERLFALLLEKLHVT